VYLPHKNGTLKFFPWNFSEFHWINVHNLMKNVNFQDVNVEASHQHWLYNTFNSQGFLDPMKTLALKASTLFYTAYEKIVRKKIA
jgi:hypothetical protein